MHRHAMALDIFAGHQKGPRAKQCGLQVGNQTLWMWIQNKTSLTEWMGLMHRLLTGARTGNILISIPALYPLKAHLNFCVDSMQDNAVTSRTSFFFYSPINFIWHWPCDHVKLYATGSSKSVNWPAHYYLHINSHFTLLAGTAYLLWVKYIESTCIFHLKWAWSWSQIICGLACVDSRVCIPWTFNVQRAILHQAYSATT